MRAHLGNIADSVALDPRPVRDGDGGGEGSAVTLDQVSKLVNDTVNGAIASLQSKTLPKLLADAFKPLNERFETLSKALEGRPPASSDGSGGGGGNDGAGSKDGNKMPPEVRAALMKSEEQLKQMGTKIAELEQEKQKAAEKAETAERNSAVREAISGFSFVSDQAARTAFELLEKSVERTDDGKLVAGNLPLKDFARDFLNNQHSYLLVPKNQGGSGGRNPGGGTGGRKKGFSLEDIKPGMTADDYSAIGSQIIEVLQES